MSQMNKVYSAHPALAAEQLHRAKSERSQRQNGNIFKSPSKIADKNHLIGISNVEQTDKTFDMNKLGILDESKKRSLEESAENINTEEDNFSITIKSHGEDRQKGLANKENKIKAITKTKDYSETDVVFPDETDHVQQRFNRKSGHHVREISVPSNIHECIHGDNCASALSSTVSSQTNSTVSSPLSTPTRFVPLQNLQSGQRCYCSKIINASLPSQNQKQYHRHQNQNTFLDDVPGGHNEIKNKKMDSRLNPSPYRQLLPIALCILSFATVFATLIVYMDTTEIRHQQFRLNMSRDYELNGVAQDNPVLIAFLRQIHMRKYPMSFLENHEPSPPFLASSLQTSKMEIEYLNVSKSAVEDDLPAMVNYVTKTVGGKMNGAAIQSLTGPLAHLITAPWFSETLNWKGVLVEPEPRWFFALRKQNAHRSRMQVVHACISPNPYAKEITIHSDDVRIKSLQDEESWFESRVKCFPLYTIMLACDRVEYDLLSLGVQGHELDILKTLPFDKVKIDIISIHLAEEDDVRNYVQSITKFLSTKSYRLQKKIKRNYFYQRLDSINRTRKKDMLLEKTP